MDQLPFGISPYLGPLNDKKMFPLEKTAENSYRDQISRCYNDMHKSYKYYGGKGVRVNYDVRDFIAWFLHWQTRLNLENPSVDRIDSNGHYEFSNIRLMDCYENRVRSWVGKIPKHVIEKRIPVLISDKKTQEPLMIAKSISQAKYLTDIQRECISKAINDTEYKYPTKCVFDFKPVQ